MIYVAVERKKTPIHMKIRKIFPKANEINKNIQIPIQTYSLEKHKTVLKKDNNFKQSSSSNFHKNNDINNYKLNKKEVYKKFYFGKFTNFKFF